MSMYKLKKVSVDSGIFIIADSKFLEEMGAEYHEGDKKNPLCYFLEVENGVYNVMWHVKHSWSDDNHGRDVLVVESGRIFVGDPCYQFSDPVVWSDALLKKNFFRDQDDCIGVETGGDGCFCVDVELDKAK
jgi:hypothetical protein